MTADEELRRALHVKADLLSRDDDRTFTHQMVRLYEVHQIIDEALAARSEPRADGLRESCERLMVAFDWTRAGAWVGLSDAEWVAVYNAIRDIRAALAATPPAEGLDVERLREAAHTAYSHDNGKHVGMGCTSTDHMLDLASVALAPEQPE